MLKTTRLLVSAIALALAGTACGGGGEAEEDRALIAERLQRLGNNPKVAACMAEEFDGAYTVDDIDIYIRARDDLSAVNFQLIEDMRSAQIACTEGD